MEQQPEKVNNDIEIFSRLKESSLDVAQKSDILDENFSNQDKSYEIQVQDAKRKISWARDFFKL